MISKVISEIIIGEKAHYEKTITENDVLLFAELSGDSNLAHIYEAYSQHSRFNERIVHGLLTASLISAVLGTQLPGVGTVYLEQSLHFLKPVMFNDTIRAEVEVISINLAKNLVELKTICTNQNQVVVLSGRALVMPPPK